MKKEIRDQFLASALYFEDSTNIAKDKCGNTWTVTGNPKIVAGSGICPSLLELGVGDSLSIENAFDLTPIGFGNPTFTIDFWMKCNNSAVDTTIENPPCIIIDMQNHSDEKFNMNFIFYKNRIYIPRVRKNSEAKLTTTVNFATTTSSVNTILSTTEDRLVHIFLNMFLWLNNPTYCYIGSYLCINKSNIAYYYGNGTNNGKLDSWWYYLYDLEKAFRPKVTITNPSDTNKLYVGYFRLWKNYAIPIDYVTDADMTSGGVIMDNMVFVS